MKSDGILKHLAIALAIALVLYFGGFTWLEHRRNVKGPWEVTFAREAGGQPRLVVNQPALGVSNVHLVFPEEDVAEEELPVTRAFAEPLPHLPYAMPFGQVIFFDTTFLPGTVTFELFGHEIELLPRVLIINREEHPWAPDGVITVRGQGVAGEREPHNLRRRW